jgi:tetratricopeptide (TPR) repeat protein
MSAPARLSLVVAALHAACSAPALLGDLAAAEGEERAGRPEAALTAYLAAQTSCRRIDNPRYRRDACAQAHLQRAELLEDLGRTAEAAEAYAAAPAALDHDPIPSANATYRAGRLYLALGDDRRGYQLLWQTITDYPDVVHAVDALRLVVADGRRRNPTQLYQVLEGLIEPLAGNEVSDNILYALAELAEEELRRPDVALAYCDRIAAEYRRGGLYDDALWHGARLARAAGDGRGAAARLRRLLATREVSYGVGSYFSAWLDDAQLELGRVLRDDLGQPRRALAAFARLPRHYPASILRDDARFESAETWARLGDRARACHELARLADEWPESRYQIERAPALRDRLDCGKIAPTGAGQPPG